MELLSQNNQNQKWYNWINDFGDRIKTLRNDDLDIEERLTADTIFIGLPLVVRRRSFLTMALNRLWSNYAEMDHKL